ncbi:MAG: WG repeat-containing protein [Dysgonamonadaceae bacterium]|jgi:hypothetical protein|nr:WG repeat-containing protein [Dysgonamonadaceae bacterium]
MKKKMWILLVVFMTTGSYCKAQDLKPTQNEDGKYGYIDDEGKEVVPFQYDDAWRFSEGLASVELDGKYGFIDKTGKVVIPIIYEMVGNFIGGKARVERMRKYIGGDRGGVVCQYNHINKKEILLGEWKEEAY